MKVRDLREYLARLWEFGQFLVTGKCDGEPRSHPLKMLSQLGQALAPFDEFEISSFGEFLTRCKQYEETGLIARRGSSKSKKPTVLPEEEITSWVNRLETLRESITPTAVTYQEIDQQCNLLASLKKDYILAIGRRLGIPLDAKKKKDLLVEGIRNHFRELKATLERAAF
ncbi:MAG: hypothetical protein NZ899_10940 [Thermoguttaceae bacterium]|nr:hypothetical protein [Thermoguttaceae bacterium]MDW8079160.1 hypothetical protein [Thermoguttaceae bacterium]